MSSTTDEGSADEEIETCATCRRDGHQICSGCLGAPDCDGHQLNPTYYCGRECREWDWMRTHKYACRAAMNRRAVYRVGDIAQLAFYAYLERLFEVSITRVEKQGNTLFLHQGRNDQNLILPFPGKLFNDEDGHGALTAMTSGNALGFVHVLVEQMLGKLVRRVARVDHIPQNCKRRIILVSPAGKKIDNATQNHAAIQITLHNNEQFAIDITCAQHGYAQPVMPWHLYAKNRIHEIKAVRPLKEIDRWQKCVDKLRNEVTPTMTKEEEFADVWGGAVEQWMAKNALISDLLQSKDCLYERNRTILLAHIDERVRKHKVHMENKGRLSRQKS